MDGSEIVISEIYCFIDFFLYAFLDILHITTTHKPYAAFIVLDSGNNEMQDSYRDQQGFGS